MDSYRLAARHLVLMVRIGWLAALVALVLLVLMGALGAPAVLVGAPLIFVLFAMVQRRWFRMILMAEPQSAAIAIGRPELVYAAYLMAAGLAAAAPGLTAMALARLAGADDAARAAALLFFMVSALLIGGRLSMVGPLVATDRSARPLNASWNGTRTHTLRLVSIPLLVMLPLQIPSLLGDATPALVLAGIGGVIALAGVLLQTTCQAVMYARLSGIRLAIDRPDGSDA